MTFDVRDSYLSDKDSARVYSMYPALERGWKKYCPTCKKRGYYFFRGERVECDCQMQVALCKHYLNAGIGLKYQRLYWDDYENKEAEAYVTSRRYIFGEEKFYDYGIGIFYFGSFGAGKTMCANLILKELVKMGRRCFATTFANTVEQFTSGWNSNDQKKYFENKFVNSDFLLLDDLGKEMRTKNNLPETLFDNLLRQREQAGKVTIITTNIKYEELAHGYGHGVLSMMNETKVLVKADNPDYRPAAMRRNIDEIKKNVTRPIV